MAHYRSQSGRITNGLERGTSPPSGAAIVQMWFNTATGVLYQYTNDGASSFWLDISSAGIGTSAGIGADEDNGGIFLLASTMNLPADDSLVLVDKPIYLMEADILEGGASVATADIFVSYEVINDA